MKGIQKLLLLITASALLLPALISCEKDRDADPGDALFCRYVNNQDFDSTGPLINAFLTDLERNRPDENLETLRSWLEAKSCVDKATILCNSCIYTLPPQSEISIDFISQRQKITLTMDVTMSDPLVFRAYHDE